MDQVRQDEEREVGSQGPRRSRWMRVLAVILALFLLLGGAAGAGVFYVYRSLQPTAAGTAKTVTIPAGTDSAGIARMLEDNGIIRNHTLFTYYLKWKKEGARFQAGAYELAPGMSNAELIDKLNKGDTLKEEVLRFTIPEGFTVEQIADKLQESGAVDKAEFLGLTDGTDTWGSSWIAQIPASASGSGTYKHRLEGYLFPETYEMKKGSGAKDIVARMVSETDRKLSSLPEGWQSQLDKLKLNFHQVLTVASLVEREVVADSERPLVAGVIYNRLQKEMPLQIDATVQYVLGKQKERLLEKDLKLESPYNTYLHAGLPPGPIASPSLASLKAALYPETTDYLFYVTKKDGSGEHWFAKTFEEHKKNIAKSKSGGTGSSGS